MMTLSLRGASTRSCDEDTQVGKPARTRFAVLAATVALALLTTGAGHAQAGENPSGPAPALASPPCDPLLKFTRSDFTEPTEIDNRWLPLVPGTQFVLKGIADRGNGPLPHRVVFTVTDLTKVINGVPTRVIWDQDINDNQLVEDELAFFAQDDRGNVWSLGEYPEEFDNGVFVGAPSTWIPGVEGAKAGVHVPANQRLGITYRQGFAPAVNFFNCAKAIKKGQEICVPAKCYEDVTIVDEWNPLEPQNGHAQKYYAPEVGNIKITSVGDPEGETLNLAEVIHLGSRALAKANAAALKLDRRAYRFSDVYRDTPPAQHSPY